MAATLSSRFSAGLCDRFLSCSFDLFRRSFGFFMLRTHTYTHTHTHEDPYAHTPYTHINKNPKNTQLLHTHIPTHTHTHTHTHTNTNTQTIQRWGKRSKADRIFFSNGRLPAAEN